MLRNSVKQTDSTPLSKNLGKELTSICKVVTKIFKANRLNLNNKNMIISTHTKFSVIRF